MTRYYKLKARHLRLGRRGEDIACNLLRAKMVDVLLRNFKCSKGEIDIIARDGAILCFVEVKTRRHSARYRPVSGLSSRQKDRIYRAAFTYLREIDQPVTPFRFDLIEVIFSRFDVKEIRHWPNHFTRANR